MATILRSPKAGAINPLKMSAPLGAALAFLGLDRCMPTLHGSQGCTAFALVLLVRHFREMVPLQTTAMNEVSTILGGMDNLEQAILNIAERTKAGLIGIASTGLTETKGEDVEGQLRLFRQAHPELDELAILYVSTPDYLGGLQEGWAKAVLRCVETFAEPCPREAGRVNVFAGPSLTPGDLECLRETIEAFGLRAVLVPDLSGSMDGHVPQQFVPTTMGGTTLGELRSLGAAEYALAIGRAQEPAAKKLAERCGVPYECFDTLIGLEPSDRLMGTLTRWSGRPVPARLRRQRSQLLDAMLDAHFFTGGKRVALGAEPDLLLGLGTFLAGMGAQLDAVVTTSESPLLETLPTREVVVGDLDDLEQRAAGCDLLLTHSHGRQMAERLGVPLLRVGLPVFDRLGAAHRVSIGYRGTRELLFRVANTLLAHESGHEGGERCNDDLRASLAAH